MPPIPAAMACRLFMSEMDFVLHLREPSARRRYSSAKSAQTSTVTRVRLQPDPCEATQFLQLSGKPPSAPRPLQLPAAARFHGAPATQYPSSPDRNPRPAPALCLLHNSSPRRSKV